jgi:hypothetical protein
MTTTEPMPKAIRAKISQKGLKKVGLLFNQTTQTLLHELLQNCRRAKADFVSVTVEKSGEKTRITISDNGEGITNPQMLLELWDSGWDETTQGLESPAGLGFFSLCHLPDPVTVRSQDWEVEINQASFHGEEDAEIKKIRRRRGTEIIFHLGEKDHKVLEDFAHCLRYYPVKTEVNHKPVQQEDFLSGAEHIYECSEGSSRIGVFEPNHSNYYAPNVNFHGLTLKVRDAEFGLSGYQIKVDVKDNKILDLVLPARNAVVSNQKLEDLATATRRAIYEFLCAGKKPHRLSFASYQEARALGYDLHEAEAKLQVAQPRALQSNDSDWDGPLSKNYQNLEDLHPVGPESLLFMGEEAELACLHIATAPAGEPKGQGKEIPLMFRASENQKGYSWYPQNQLSNVRQILHIGTGKKGRKVTLALEGNMPKSIGVLGKKATYPTKIEVVYEIKCKGKTKKHSLESPMAFVESYDGGYATGDSWTPLRHTEVSEKVVDNALLHTLFFNPSDDPESNSYDSQNDDFDAEADENIILAFRGDKEARDHGLSTALNEWSVVSAIQNMGLKSLTLEIKDGIIVVTKTVKERKTKSK